MADALSAFGDRVEKIVSPETAKKMISAAGVAGKKSALEAAAKSLGGDRAFSGMRRKTALSAGYDEAGAAQVQINFRPAGLWKLAEAGRRSSGQIRPKGSRGARRSGAKRAVLTPQGPRAGSSYGPSRGLDTFSDAVKDAQRSVPKAAAQAFRDAVAAAVR